MKYLAGQRRGFSKVLLGFHTLVMTVGLGEMFALMSMPPPPRHVHRQISPGVEGAAESVRAHKPEQGPPSRQWNFFQKLPKINVFFVKDSDGQTLKVKQSWEPLNKWCCHPDSSSLSY